MSGIDFNFLREEYKKEEKYRGEWPTLPESLRITAEICGDKEWLCAFSGSEIEMTFREAQENVMRIARHLTSVGVKKGDKVAVTGKNSPMWALAYFGVVECGGVIVPIDYNLSTGAIGHLLSFSDAVALFSDEEKYDSLGDGSSIVHKFSLSPNKPNYILDIEGDESLTYESPECDDLAAILFTSGTTGNEKGVMLSHKNLISDCYQALTVGYLEITREDVMYALLPLNHSYGMTGTFILSAVCGCKLVFAAGLVISNILNDLKQGGVTIFLCVPLLYNKLIKGILKKIRAKGLLLYGIVRLLMATSLFFRRNFKVNIGKKLFKSILKQANLTHVKYMISGGGPLAASTVNGYNALGIGFIQGFGLTETAPITHINPARAFKLPSVGKTLPLTEIKVIDKDENGIGEVLMRGPNVTRGYYKNEEATQDLFAADGFLKTGDLGWLDGDNYLYITGRKKNMIVTEGGKNVFPEEVEDHFQLYFQIEQILVKGYILDARKKSEGVEAIIYPSEDYYKELGLSGDAIQEDILQVVRKVNRELLPSKRISQIRIVGEPMEMTTTKKLKRHIVDEWLKKREEPLLSI